MSVVWEVNVGAIKTQTESGLVRTLYGREPDEQPVLRGTGLGGAGYPLALAALATVFLVLALACGCSNTTERREHLIRAGRILLRHSTPEAGWESRRETWLAASEIEAPDAAPVASGQ